MKQFAFVWTLLVFGMNLGMVHGQCELDTTLLDTTGVFPSQLADGEVGVAYDQTIHFVFPTEITLFIAELNSNITANLCSYSLDSIPNLPEGLNLACNTEDCTWDINFDSGFVNRGCVQISGIPETRVRDDDSLSIFLTIAPGAYDTTNNVCSSLALPEDIVRQYAVQEFRIPFIIQGDTAIVDTGITALEWLDESLYQVSLYPNPASQVSNLTYMLPQTELISLEVRNLLGQVVWRQNAAMQLPGKHQVSLPTSDWATGIYSVRLLVGDRKAQYSAKLEVQ